MQQSTSQSIPKPCYRFCTALWLVGMLLLSASLFVFSPKILANSMPPNIGSNQFPTSAADILRQDLSKHTGIAVTKLQLVEAIQKTWSDGCLGLARPDELCSQALVDGWQVTFSDGSQRWNYHTDMNGQIYRLVEMGLPH